MTIPSSSDLRPLVSAVVREALSDLVAESVRAALDDSTLASRANATSGGHLTPGLAPAPGGQVEAVRIADDKDLDQFARRLLVLFENPKNRQDLRTGRLRFRLAPQTTSGVAPAGRRVRRVEKGAVTERHIMMAAENGERLVLGPRAMLTPLGRDKARALGVQTEREQ